jgi:hypothetical protein
MTTTVLPKLAETVPVIFRPRPGQFRGICFRPDGGDEDGEDDKDEDDEDEEDEDKDAEDKKAKKKSEGKKEGVLIELSSAKLKAKLANARGQERKTLFEELGVTDAEELKALLTKLKDLETAQMSEVDKAKADAKDAQAKLKALQDVADRDAAERKQAAEERKFERWARKAGVSDDEDFEDIVLPKMRKFAAKELSGDGDLSAEDFEEFFAELKTKKPSLFEVRQEDANSGPQKKQPGKHGVKPLPAKPVKDMTPVEYKQYKLSMGIVV